MLDFYQAKKAILPSSPKQQYRDDAQALIDDHWDDTTQLYTVSEEYPFGTFDFKDVDCHLIRGRDRSIGIKTGDDYRELVFQSIDKDVQLGTYYIFDDSYWLTVNKDTLNRIDGDIIVRRCNNWLKWRDSNNKICAYPVVCEYEVSRGTPRPDKDTIPTPTNTISLIIQANDSTLKLGVNQRFIISGRVYKLESMNNYLMPSAYGKQEILYYKVSLDEISPYDDFENGIAYNGNIEVESDVGRIEVPVYEGLCVEPIFDELRQNYSKEIEANLWIGGAKQVDDVVVTTSGAPSWAWELEKIEHNKWLLRCKRVAQVPLELTFECRGEIKSMIVALTSMF